MLALVLHKPAAHAGLQFSFELCRFTTSAMLNPLLMITYNSLLSYAGVGDVADAVPGRGPYNSLLSYATGFSRMCYPQQVH